MPGRNRWVWAAAILTVLASISGRAAETTLDWTVRAYGDGEHNAFTDLVRWHDRYYLCFRHGASHLSMDGEIRVLSSPDLRTWTPCGVLDTLADDRDPHFATTDDALYVFFGVWDLVHARDNGVPGRGRLRSHFASTHDGEQWSPVQGTYEPDWWLWRVRWFEDRFLTVAYTLTWPAQSQGEARLLSSADGLHWDLVSTVTKDRMPDEADMRFLADGSMEVVMRTCDGQGDAMLLRSDPALAQWQRKDLGVVVHSPVFAMWKDRCFVAGRGAGDGGAVTRVWERVDDTLRECITLPSGGDTAYPGLIVDPASLEGPNPALFVSWYSQHERQADKPDEASVYVGRITVKP